jgi:phosphoglycolate phosphatase
MHLPADFAPRRFPFIAFDWDGTLADSTTIIADSLRRACVDVGEPAPPEVDARFVIGLGLAEAVRHVAPGLPARRYPELVACYRRRFIERDEHIALFDGVREMLAELEAAGFILGIATGKSRAGLERALAQQGIGGHFIATRCADEGMPKPHPDMLFHLMDRVGVACGETLVVGDTTHDLDLAKNAGASALAVGYGAHAPEGLAARGPLATVHSVADLRSWLRAHA